MPPPTHLNKNGFTLIELIIVIAIMAILVGVLAPNLLRYIDKANMAANVQLADSIRTAFVVAIADSGSQDGYFGSGAERVLDQCTIVSSANGYPPSGRCSGELCTNGFNECAESHGQTPFGAAVSETLGYPDYPTLVGTNGITNEFRPMRGVKNSYIYLEIRQRNSEVGMLFQIVDSGHEAVFSKFIPEHAADFGGWHMHYWED